VLDRTAPNLAASGAFPQMGAAGAGNCIEAAAWKLDFSDSDSTAALFRLAKMGRLQMGEAQGQVKGTLSLEANDEEVARLMSSVGQGVLALMKLQRDNPGWAKLAKGLALKRDGARVIVSLAMPATEAIELLKADDARKARKKAGQD